MTQTPMMRQYQQVKAQYPGALLLFRLGDFYEMFFEDAVLASRLLGLTLTSRSKGDKAVPMAGVPYHAVHSYVKRLIQAGYKVALCDQIEDPREAKGLVGREGHVSEITQRSGLDVTITVEGAEAAVRAALGSRPLGGFKQIAPQQFQVVLSVLDQATVNGIIDDLRRGEVGVMEIARPRRTLEEAFLEVVAEDRPAR